MAVALQRPPINPDYKWDQDPASVEGNFPALAHLTSQHHPQLYPDPTRQGGSFKASLVQLLSTLAGLLEDVCLDPRQTNLHGAHQMVLAQTPSWPLLYPFQDQCMVFDPQKVRRSGLPVWVSGKSRCRYLEINLGNGFPHTNAVVITAHRLLCWAHKGPVPPGASVVVEHMCENSMCGNPIHLEYGTKSSNGKRALRGRGSGGMRGRGTRGEGITSTTN
jgi:hypothetical protein